jgi:hypothetical protein
MLDIFVDLDPAGIRVILWRSKGPRLEARAAKVGQFEQVKYTF